jgi:hypothetical protein
MILLWHYPGHVSFIRGFDRSNVGVLDDYEICAKFPGMSINSNGVRQIA